MRVQISAIKVMEQACRGGHMPTMRRRGDLYADGEGHSRRIGLIDRGRQQRSIYTPSIFDCATELSSSKILQTLLMAGELQGRRNDIIYSGNPRVTMFTWVWSGVLMPPLVLINSSPSLIAQHIHAPLCFLHANLALYSPINMVRPRQRMLSHRGSN